MEGTVTISLKDFENLKKEADEAKKLRQQMNEIGKEVSDIVAEIDESEAKPIFDEIDSKQMTDAQIHRNYLKAVSKFKIIVDGSGLKKLIRKYIDEKYSEAYSDIQEAKDSVLDKIGIEIKEG